MRKLIRNFKLDDWIFFLTGLLAIALSVLGFFINFKIETAIQILLGSIGLLITAVVALKSQRHDDIQEIKSTISHSRSILISRKDFVPHAKKYISTAKDFILDTTLNTTAKPFTGTPPKSPVFMVNEYHKLISERVFKREITYRRVEVIHTSERLELTIARLLLHNGYDFLVRHYEPPPKPMPIINLMSIDNEKIYLGGHDISIDSKFMFIEDVEFCDFLAGYWQTLWSSARPLNESTQIDWEALKEIGQRLNISENEFNNIVEKWTDWAIHERKKYPK